MNSLFFYNFELLRMKKIIFSGIVNNPIPSIFNTNDIIFPAVFQGDIGPIYRTLIASLHIPLRSLNFGFSFLILLYHPFNT